MIVSPQLEWFAPSLRVARSTEPTGLGVSKPDVSTFSSGSDNSVDGDVLHRCDFESGDKFVVVLVVLAVLHVALKAPPIA